MPAKPAFGMCVDGVWGWGVDRDVAGGWLSEHLPWFWTADLWILCDSQKIVA